MVEHYHFYIKGVNLKEVKSELTVKQIKKLEKNFKDLGIDIEAAVKESVDMVAKSPEVKKAINAIYKNNKTVSEKFKEVDIDAVEKFNNGNQNLLKLLTESHRLNNDKWYYRS
jgi:acyl-[acyl carrier protein]--UDP-N-acetylglucosamine O-acyltransferase